MPTAFKTRWFSNNTDFQKVDTTPLTTSNLTKLVPSDTRLSLLSFSKQIVAGNGSYIQVEGGYSIHAYMYTNPETTQLFLDILSIYTEILGKDHIHLDTGGSRINGKTYFVFLLIFDNQEIFDKYVYATNIIKMRFDEDDLQKIAKFKLSDSCIDDVLEHLSKY